MQNHNFSDITNINAYSNSFDFLKNEPDSYNIFDIKKIILGKIGRLSNGEALLLKDKIKNLFL